MSDVDKQQQEQNHSQLKQQMEAELAKIGQETKEEVKQESPEVKEDVENTLTQDPQQEPEKSFTEEEKEAISQGWDPNRANERSAKEFLERGSFFKKISEQKKSIDDLKDTVKQLVDHNTKIEKAAYERGLKYYQDLKAQAEEQKDFTAYKEAEKQEKELQEKIDSVTPKQEVSSQPQAPQVTTEDLDALKSFATKNAAWFNFNTVENKIMAVAADTYEASLKVDEPGLTQAERLEKTEKYIKETFANRFENKNQNKPAMVGTSTPGTGSKASLASKLTDQQRAFAEKVKASDPKFSYEEYARQLNDMGRLGK